MTAKMVLSLMNNRMTSSGLSALKGPQTLSKVNKALSNIKEKTSKNVHKCAFKSQKCAEMQK